MSKFLLLEMQIADTRAKANQANDLRRIYAQDGRTLLAQQQAVISEAYSRAAQHLEAAREALIQRLKERKRMNIYTFNTGRMYSQSGQRIAYCQLLRDCSQEPTTMLVAFVDADRGIAAVVRTAPCWDRQEMDAAVLAQYDACAYERQLLIPNDIEDALREAALATAPVA